MPLRAGTKVETRKKGPGFFSGIIVEAAGRKKWIVNVLSPNDGAIIAVKTVSSGQLREVYNDESGDKLLKSKSSSPALIPSIYKSNKKTNWNKNSDKKSNDNQGYQELLSDEDEKDKGETECGQQNSTELQEKEAQQVHEEEEQQQLENVDHEQEGMENMESQGVESSDDSSISDENKNDNLNPTSTSIGTNDNAISQDENIDRILLCDDPVHHNIGSYDVEDSEILQQTRSEKYKREKQELLDSNWKVDVDANYNCKGAPKPIMAVCGANVICKHGTRYEGHNGVLIERIGRGKWIVEIEIDQGVERQQMISRHFEVISDPSSLYTWKIVEDIEENCFKTVEEYTNIGVVGFDPSLLADESNEDAFFKLFQYLWPGEWKHQLKQCNLKIQNSKRSNPAKYSRVKLVSEKEWWTFIGIIIYGGAVGKGGSKLYEKKQRGISSPINIGKDGLDIMSYKRLNEIREFFPFSFHDAEAKKKGDEWYQIGLLVDGFNYNRKHTIASSSTITFDESMAAWKPRTTALGGLPNLSFVKRKPRPIGTEFKNAACTVLGEH